MSRCAAILTAPGPPTHALKNVLPRYREHAMRRKSLIVGCLVGGAFLSGIYALFGAGEQPARSASDDVSKVAAPVSNATGPAPEYDPDATGHREIALPFLTKHCSRCHGADVREGGFR